MGGVGMDIQQTSPTDFMVRGTPSESAVLATLLARLGARMLDGWIADKQREHDDAMGQRAERLTDAERAQIPPPIRAKLGL